MPIKIQESGHCGNHYNNDSSNNSVSRALPGRLKDLGFASFQSLVVLWLGAHGYSHLRSLGRHARRGRRRIGGADFIARLPGSPHTRVAIQLRHSATPVQRRAVDELRGFMLRFGIPTGLIVSNTRFYPAAQKAANEFPGRPIDLVPGYALASSVWSLGVEESRWDRVGSSCKRLFNLVDKLRLAPMLSRTPGRATSERTSQAAAPCPPAERACPHSDFGSQMPEPTVGLVIAAALLTLLAVLVGALLR